MPAKTRKRKADPEVEPKGVKPALAAPATTEEAEITHWLIKSEPETRIENGVDMRFSFEDLRDALQNNLTLRKWLKGKITGG